MNRLRVGRSGSAVVEASGRFRRRRRRRQAAVGVGIALLATVGAAGWELANSGVFALRHVIVNLTVNSTSSLTAAEVTAAAHAPIGVPLMHLDVARVVANVEQLPTVKAVSARREWPNDLVLDVTARRAAVIVVGSDGRFLADASGVLFRRVGGASQADGAHPSTAAPPGATVPPAVLPVLRTPGVGWTVGRTPHPRLRAAVAALRSVPVRLQAQARALEWTSTGLSFRERGVTVVWGGPADAAIKAAALRSVLHRKPARRPPWVDVSAGGVLVTGTGHSAG